MPGRRVRGDVEVPRHCAISVSVIGVLGRVMERRCRRMSK